MCILPDLYLQQLENAILQAASNGSALESSQRLDIERCKSQDGLANACLQLLRRRGWGSEVHLRQHQQLRHREQAPSSNHAASSSKLIEVAAQYDAVAFYALTTIQRSPIFSCSSDNFSVILRDQLRSILLATLSHTPSLCSMPQFFATKIAVLLALLMREEYPTHWSNPLRDLLEVLNLFCAPSITANHAIITLDQMACMGVYLSFLNAINDEIVYPAVGANDAHNEVVGTTITQRATERKRRQEVKDALRGFPLGDTDLTRNDDGILLLEPSVPLEQTDAAQIIGWLLNLIVSATTCASTPKNNDFDVASSQQLLTLAVRAAATMHRYLSWVDIRLAMHRNLVQMLLKGLGGASSSSPSTCGENREDSSGDDEPTIYTQLAVQCAKCLQEIVDRGMDEQRKLTLLTELSLFDTLVRFSQVQSISGGASAECCGRLDLRADGTTQIEAVSAAAELINSAGLALIQGWEVETSSLTSTTQMKQCLELALACLAYDSIDVSGVVVDIISRILVSLEKKEACWNNVFSDLCGSDGETVCDYVLLRILLILHARMKYPTDFAFDYEDVEESEEEVYRENLRKVYQRIVRLRPQIVLSFVGQCFTSLPQTLAQSATADIECALRLVYHFGEGRRPAPGAKTALRDGQFRQVIIALHCSDVLSHPHREVLILYYDICVRYSDILKESPELLTLILGSFLSDRGLQHPHTRVRCRCCYQLLRLIKSIGAMAMRPNIEAVVDGIQVLLFPTMQQASLTIPAEEALYLFEATGILLGTSGLDADIQVKCITAVLTPHIRLIEQSLDSPDLAQNVEVLGERLSMSVSAIAQLSKGWQKSPPSGVQTVLMAAIDVCRNVLVTIPSCPLVRNRTAVLLQRMILCVGEQILPVMPSFFTQLISFASSEEDILDASQLINQLCIIFREKATESIDSVILPFLRKVLAVQGHEIEGDSDIAPPPHLITEQLSVRKQAFSTLQHIAFYNVSEVLYSSINVASLGDVLQLMKDGAVSVPDPVMNKTCNRFFCALIKRWGCNNDGQNPIPPPLVNDAFFDFVYDVYVPGMLSSIFDDNDFNVKDAIRCRVLAEFSVALWLLKQSRRGNAEFHSRVVDLRIREGGSNGTIGCTQIGDDLQHAKSGKEMELILKSWKEAKVTRIP